MSRSVFVILLALIAVAAVAQAQVVVRGILWNRASQPFPVDSVMMESQSGREWFPCPEWSADPMAQDTFVFPAIPRWPEVIVIAAFPEGMPLEMPIPMPVRDSFYRLDPPFEMVQVKFQELVGVESRPEPRRRGALSVLPGVVRDAAVIRARDAGLVEVFDAAGNVVLSFAAPTELNWRGDDQSGRALARGVYFCRLTGSAGTTVCRFVLVR
ncbi:hypothetical protein FJY69_04745 [candidate division WOR-3 bacterium]|nr:hypothetical protein [candidate division WOR-3 bacterium]